MCAQLCLTLFNSMDHTCQAPLSMGFPRQEYGSHFPPPRDLPNPGINCCLLWLLIWQANSLQLSHLKSPCLVLASSETHSEIRIHVQVIY